MEHMSPNSPFNDIFGDIPISSVFECGDRVEMMEAGEYYGSLQSPNNIPNHENSSTTADSILHSSNDYQNSAFDCMQNGIAPADATGLLSSSSDNRIQNPHFSIVLPVGQDLFPLASQHQNIGSSVALHTSDVENVPNIYISHEGHEEIASNSLLVTRPARPRGNSFPGSVPPIEPQIKRRHSEGRRSRRAPHECPNCSQKFPLKRDLSVHRDKEHGIREHRCEDCAKSFNRSDNMKNHQRKLHQQLSQVPSSPGCSNRPSEESSGTANDMKSENLSPNNYQFPRTTVGGIVLSTQSTSSPIEERVNLANLSLLSTSNMQVSLQEFRALSQKVDYLYKELQNVSRLLSQTINSSRSTGAKT